MHNASNNNDYLFLQQQLKIKQQEVDALQIKLNEIQTSNNQDNLQNQIENIPDAIYSVDKQMLIQTINSNAKKNHYNIFGVTLAVGEHLYKGLSAETIKAWDILYKRCFNGETFSMVVPLMINQQNQIFEVTFNPIIHKQKVSGVSCFTRNITLQEQYQQALKEREANLQAQIENTTNDIWSIDSHFNLLTFNSNFQRNIETAFGIKLEAGINIIDSLPTEYVPIWKKRYQRALNGEAYKETDYFPFENIPQYVEVLFNPIRLDNKIIGVSCFSRDITAQFLNENALKEREQRYKTLVSNIPSTTFRCKVDKYWTMEFISNEIENLCGYSAEDFIQNKNIAYADIIYAEDAEQVEREIMYAVSNHLKYSIEYRIVHKNGSHIWVHERGRGSYNQDNEVLWLDGVKSNISERKKAEKAITESEEKFRTIFESSSSAIAIQTDKEILLVNKAWEKITGYKAKEAKKLNPYALIHPQIRKEMKEKNLRRLNGEAIENNYHLHINTKEGNERWIDISASLITFEGQKATLLFGTDITEQKLNDLQIKKLSIAIANTPSSIVITDIDGEIEYVNPYFCEFTGYSFEEAVGENPRILNSGNNNPELFKNLWATILNGEIWNGEIQNKRKNGELYWENARIAPIMDEDGIIINFVAIKEDITESKRYQEMIEQSEKDLRELNAKKDKFFSIIAHDLRSPFVGLVGLTDLLKDNYDELSEDKIKSYLKYANEAAHNVFKLLENLLEWAKSQTGKIEFKPERISLTELIQDAFGIVNLLANNKEITLINYAYSNTELSADKNMVFTVLRNLIANAIKYTPRKGRIEIDAKTEGRFVVVSVKDNGLGIPLKIQKQLFNIEENFSTPGTEKEKGSGLGLIICKEFIEKHGGKIWCESEEGKGSTFFFTLPTFKRQN